MATSDKLGLGLDDIIRIDGSGGRRGARGGKRGFRSRGGGREDGNFFGGSNGFRTRGGGGIPRSSNTPAVGRWKHDLFEENTGRVRAGPRTSGGGGVNSTTKLLISNLDYNVTTNDVQELFEDVGAIRVARVHYDESGRSIGTGEVVFERRADAVTALKKYNNVNLDGRPMDIKMLGGAGDDAADEQSSRVSYGNGGGGNPRSGLRGNYQQNGNRGGANRSRGGRAQQNGSGKKENVTAEDLDADLEAYRAESAPKK